MIAGHAAYTITKEMTDTLHDGKKNTWSCGAYGLLTTRLSYIAICPVFLTFFDLPFQVYLHLWRCRQEASKRYT